MHATGITKRLGRRADLALGMALLLTAVVVAYRSAWNALGLRLERWLPRAARPC
jgi:hypothetical protein